MVSLKQPPMMKKKKKKKKWGQSHQNLTHVPMIYPRRFDNNFLNGSRHIIQTRNYHASTEAWMVSALIPKCLSAHIWFRTQFEYAYWLCHKYWRDWLHLVNCLLFSFTRDITLVTLFVFLHIKPSYLPSYTSEWVYSKGKQFAPKGSRSISLKEENIFERVISPESVTIHFNDLLCEKWRLNSTCAGLVIMFFFLLLE